MEAELVTTTTKLIFYRGQAQRAWPFLLSHWQIAGEAIFRQIFLLIII
jgi:hypothetical protein